MITAVLALAGAQVKRHIHRIRHIDREPETSRHDTNDGVRAPIHLDLLSNGGVAAAEVLPPYFVAQDNHIVPAVSIFSGSKRSTEDRVHSEHVEEIVRALNLA